MKALKENPVAVQSKQMLLNALLELMEKRHIAAYQLKNWQNVLGLTEKPFIEILILKRRCCTYVCRKCASSI